MRGIRCLVAAVLAAGIVTVVAAQPGGGFGGFGGGDTTTLVLTNAALQEEVKLTAAQKTKFKEISEKNTENLKKSMEGMKEKFADAQGDKEKMTELFTTMQKENAKVAAETRKSVEAELTAEQKTRLKQIGVQMLGINAFADPESKMGTGMFTFGFSEAQKATIKEVADALKLTDAQKTKIKGLLDEYNKDIASVRTDIFGEKIGKGSFTQEKQKDFTTKSAKLTTEVMGKITDSLDDTQKTAWKGLVGDAFDVSKLRPTFGPPKKDKD